MSDEIYQIIEIAQLKGLCGYIQGTKPYTQKQVLKAIDEILSNEEMEFVKEIEEVKDVQILDKTLTLNSFSIAKTTFFDKIRLLL